VIGKNGKGKTTLLRLLAGELSPLAGSVELHPRARTGYYVQTNVSMLRKNFTVEEEIASSLEGGEKKNARDICGAMLFEGDEALKRIAVLSGGEMSRVLIGKILAAPANLLLLDEPTNHLDMESADALLAALDNFDGAVVIVTHNELFLNALATRLVVFQRGGVKVHEGSYQSFLEKTGWEDEADKAGISPPGRVAGKKELRRLRSEIVARRSKTLRPLEELIEDVERRIRDVALAGKHAHDRGVVPRRRIENSGYCKGHSRVENRARRALRGARAPQLPPRGRVGALRRGALLARWDA